MAQTTQKVFEPRPEAPTAERPTGMWLPHDENLQGTAYELAAPVAAAQRLAYVETYGCQMNFSDTEIVASVLSEQGYGFTRQPEEADLVLINTCSIRENAEEKVWNRLEGWKNLKKRRPGMVVGVLGCMAERLKHKLLEESRLVDLVVGPDAYRSLPALLAEVETGQRAVNVLLSREETYADLAPVRLNTNGVSAFISIMRGCNNMCSFCVVPFTRGRERSREAASIVHEAQDLVQQGYREVTLLGQNVDSYADGPHRFADLLRQVARVDPLLRVRFSTSHPKDMTDDVLHAMAEHPNLCKFIHLPVQSGSSAVLERMRRGYSREWYLERIERIRQILPGCGLSTDIIAGFCGETEAEHRETLSLMEAVRFDHAFMFYYSERPGTLAARQLADDVPLEVKKERLQQIIALQQQHSAHSNQAELGTTHQVLVEGEARRGQGQASGRTDSNKMVVFPAPGGQVQPGQYLNVRITHCTSATLLGEVV